MHFFPFTRARRCKRPCNRPWSTQCICDDHAQLISLVFDLLPRRLAPVDRENEAAFDSLRLEERVGIGGLLEGEDAIDLRPQLLARQERKALLLQGQVRV